MGGERGLQRHNPNRTASPSGARLYFFLRVDCSGGTQQPFQCSGGIWPAREHLGYSEFVCAFRLPIPPVPKSFVRAEPVKKIGGGPPCFRFNADSLFRGEPLQSGQIFFRLFSGEVGTRGIQEPPRQN